MVTILLKFIDNDRPGIFNSIWADVSSIPRIGEQVAYEGGYAGTVSSVFYWWSEQPTNELIEVTIR